ncbi:MAG: WXG100 family type VII secretion target [Arthrobacter sp.]|nr:WXG100 family type VII secretion target [Arthrobacter sp.]MDZ4353002.1 WXG100 family type VII secretion target [Arthrobacter sp.]
MAGNLWGADVAQLRTLAQQFGKTSETLLQQSTTLTSAINGNTAWKGADGARFTSEWNGSHRALIQKTALALKAESKRLMTHAEQQEKASNNGSGAGGGTGAPGPGGNGSGGNWALLGGAAAVGGLRAAMGIQKNIKAPLTLAKHVGQFGWVLKNQRADFIKSFVQGKHRIGGPGFAPHRLISNPALDDLLKGSTAANRGLAAVDKASDIVSLKNLNKYIGPLGKFEGFFAEKPWLGAGTKLEWLGKSGLARGLGWAGVGFSAVDSVRSFADGDLKGGAASLGRTALGIGCFLPPPAGTVCQVASVGIAVYENWDTISSVGKNVGEGIVNAVKDPGKFVSDAADTVTDAGKSVANFFGFGD